MVLCSWCQRYAGAWLVISSSPKDDATSNLQPFNVPGISYPYFFSDAGENHDLIVVYLHKLITALTLSRSSFTRGAISWRSVITFRPCPGDARERVERVEMYVIFMLKPYSHSVYHTQRAKQFRITWHLVKCYHRERGTGYWMLR